MAGSGSEHDIGRIQEYVDDFQLSLGPDFNLCATLDVVSSDEFGEGIVGSYRPFSKHARVLAESGPDTVWHELCHAVWHQNPHVRDMLGSVPEDIDLEMNHPHTATSRSRRSEHFAQVCEQGPMESFLLYEPCEEDPPFVDTTLAVQQLFTAPSREVRANPLRVRHEVVAKGSMKNGVYFGDAGVELWVSDGWVTFDPYSGLPADRTHVERSKASAPFEWNDTHLTRRDFSMWDQGAHRMVLQASGSLWAAGCWPSEAGRVMFDYDGTLWTADSESQQTRLRRMDW